MIKNLTFSALFAGLAAGLIAAALQILLLVPLVQEAELYETGQLIHFADVAAPMPDIEPEQNWARNGLTILFTATVYIGFAFVLIAAIAFAQLKGVAVTTRTGILWGLAGYTAIQLAPSLGLAPELPGMIAAELAPRQIWWFGTVAATLAGLAAIVFGKDRLQWGAGALILGLPHIIGAPHPEVYGGVVPPELAAEFASRSLVVGAISWAILGAFCAFFWLQENR